MGRTVKLVTLTGVLIGVALLAVLMLATHGTAPVFRTAESAHPAVPASTAYTVSMSPVGEVTFPKVPERIVTQDANYNDILVAVGEAAHLQATGYRGNFFDGFYHQLPGAASGPDPARLTYLARGGGGMFDKELLYALHPDVFHIDPLQLAGSKGWTTSDVEEIAHNVAPFFANRYSRDHSYLGKLPYTYYTVMELAQKVAEVYRRPERIALLSAIRDRLVAAIQAKLPPEDQRPRVGLVFYGKGRFTTYSVLNQGFGQAQYRDIGVRDAFAGIKDSAYGSGSAAALDLEGLVAIAPDVLIMPFAIYPVSETSTSRASYEQLLKLKDDPLAQRMPAFRDGRVYPGGTPLQGPVFYLFQIEMAAKQVYPELFGSYRDDQDYPPQERLFDRAEVAEAISGKAAQP